VKEVNGVNSTYSKLLLNNKKPLKDEILPRSLHLLVRMRKWVASQDDTKEALPQDSL